MVMIGTITHLSFYNRARAVARPAARPTRTARSLGVILASLMPQSGDGPRSAQSEILAWLGENVKVRQHTMRVLLVEDEPDLLRSLAQAFREEGYAVDTAADGEDGLYKAESWGYDVIVLDVMLPKLDGWGVLKSLRKTRTTPVLMLTARDQSRDRVRGLDGGADDYVVKPFDLPELLARVRALSRRSASEKRAVLEIGDVRLDTAARQVSRGQEEIPLTAREYALLEYLALHRGKVVTRTELYEHLFDENEFTLSNLLDVHVSNLRKKLGHDFITTRRGHGYCIEAET
jgi:two-component system, OmpR family, response regulator